MFHKIGNNHRCEFFNLEMALSVIAQDAVALCLGVGKRKREVER